MTRRLPEVATDQMIECRRQPECITHPVAKAEEERMKTKSKEDLSRKDKESRSGSMRIGAHHVKSI